MGDLVFIPKIITATPIIGWGVRKMLGICGITDDPQIIIKSPYNPATESYLVWWQIDVENKQREKCNKWWPTKKAERCFIKLKFTRISDNESFEVNGRWQTNQSETLQYKDLVIGEDSSTIPIVGRSNQIHNCYIIWEPNITYVTATEFLHHGNDKDKLEAGSYDVTVSVYSGNKLLREKLLWLNIPQIGIDDFVLKD